MVVQVNVTGKNMNLGDTLETLVREKFQRLACFLRPDDYVDVVVVRVPTKEIQDHYAAEVNLIASGSLVLRGEEHAATPEVAVNALVDRTEERLAHQHAFIESER